MLNNNAMIGILQGCALAALILAVAMLPDASREIQAQEDLYCEMVQLSIDTQGELGWPDYENKFKKVCVE